MYFSVGAFYAVTQLFEFGPGPMSVLILLD